MERCDRLCFGNALLAAVPRSPGTGEHQECDTAQSGALSVILVRGDGGLNPASRGGGRKKLIPDAFGS